MALWSPIQKAVGNSKDLAAYQRDITPEAVLQRAEIAKPPTLESSQDTRAANLDKFDGYNYTPVQVMGNLHPGSRNFMSLSMDTLELLARVPVCDAALGVRIGQVIKHGRPQKHPFEEGYRIKLREPQQQASPAARKRAQEISNWLRTCGDPRLRENATFQSFLASFVRDSMIYDQACAEVVYGYGREPAGFVPVDARTIRRAQPSTTEVNRQRQGPPRLVKGPPRYVQVLNNEITAQWEYDQFIFGVRNPRTDIRVSGYGYPELERLFTVVYDLVNAQSYNARNFTNGMHLNGVLALMSAMNKETFDAVSADFRGMAHGVSNAHRGMIMQLNPDLKEALQWIPMSASNREMEFGGWIGFLLKLTCFVPGTRVTLADGTNKVIEDIRAGDRVLTHTGEGHQVQNLQIKQAVNEPLVTLRTMERDIHTTREHPFYVRRMWVDGNERRQFHEPEWVLAENLIPGTHYLIAPIDEHAGSTASMDLRKYVECYLYGAEHIRLRPHGSRETPIRREIPLTSDNCFILGLAYAEASCEKGRVAFCLHEDEEEYAQRVEAFAARMGVPTTRKYQPERHSLQVVIRSSLLGRAWRQAIGSNAKSKRVPVEIMQATKECQQAFLSGLLAGDGFVGCPPQKSSPMAHIATASNRGAADICQLFARQGMIIRPARNARAAIQVGKYTSPASTLNTCWITGTNMDRLAEWGIGPKCDLLRGLLAAHDAVVAKHPRSRRKSQVYERPGQKLLPILRKGVELYTGPVYNLEVETDHSYVVEDVAVHNCAVLQMDPAELGFQFGNEGQSSSFASQGPGERVQLSKERGLYPILRNIEDWINDKIIHKIDPDFELVLAGYDQASELAKQEWIGKVIKTHYTVNEVRAIDDLDPIEGPAGNIILDGIYSSSVQYFDQQAQMQQQQQQQAEAELAMMGGGSEEGGAPPISDEEIAAMFAEEPDAEAEIAKALTYSSDSGEVLEAEVW